MTTREAIQHGKEQLDVFGGTHKEFIEIAIEALQERKTGEWFDLADEYDKRAQKHDYFCLECKTHADDFICGSEDWWCGKPPKYCPNCGAKMEVDNDGKGID